MSEPNPYYWHNDGGWWPYPWDNWPTKTPWDHQRNRFKSGQSVELEEPGSIFISNDIDQIPKAPTPSTEYEGLPLASSMEGALSFSPSDSINDDEVGSVTFDTMDMGVDDLFQEQPEEDLDISLPIPDSRIWDELHDNLIASVDAELPAITQYDPQSFINDPDGAIFSSGIKSDP